MQVCQHFFKENYGGWFTKIPSTSRKLARPGYKHTNLWTYILALQKISFGGNLAAGKKRYASHMSGTAAGGPTEDDFTGLSVHNTRQHTTVKCKHKTADQQILVKLW